MATTASLLRLSGKVCIVTGASSGLGRSIALGYAREGAIVVCADLQQQARADVNGEGSFSTDDIIRSSGGKSIFVQTDVSKAPAVEAMVQKAVAEFGRIDVIHDTPEESWDLTIAVNLKSVFLTCKYTIAQMLQQEKLGDEDRGWIINLSSIFGIVASQRMPSYAASKGGVSNLTRQVALDYASEGIHCNAICPGYTETAIFADTMRFADREEIRSRHPLHGTGQPQDVVGAAIFLASPEARWITGVSLPVDGGYTAR
ncbi:hypothetical protein FZEAL_2749 [Fusarium zealandicum]|uniref:Short-chain dehydrogenase n=1 Tax=Fusarium zealandicum TaxID=1053134 RepID=A0A8H4XN59_9HYPO|nr:hypothetical protein FZEAL_2749 [Fusarium zealandicum]